MREQRGSTRVLRALEALRMASSDLLRHENPRDSPPMRALLELESRSEGLLRGDPDLHRLSLLLSRLRDFSRSPPSPRPRLPLLPFRRASADALASTAASIASEIQSWIDRESLRRLSAALRHPGAAGDDDDEVLGLLACLESRVGGGFDGALQAALLRSGAFPALESALADPRTTKHVRDGCAAAVAAVVRFNRDVFVARAAVVRSLVAMATPVAARALRALVADVGGPLVAEMERRGEIPRVAALLGEGAEVAAAAAEVVMEVGFHGRKEAVEALLEGGVVERLVALQREAEEEEGGVRAGGLAVAGDAERRPLAMCAARFALMVEAGGGLRHAEKRAFRSELVRRVRAVASDAYAASIVAEILWGTAT